MITTELDSYVAEHSHHMAMVHGDAWIAYTKLKGCEDLSECDFLNDYHGSASSPAAWAFDYAESTGMFRGIDADTRNRIDYEDVAADLHGFEFQEYLGDYYAFHV